jgi:CHAT domain-containing protein
VSIVDRRVVLVEFIAIGDCMMLFGIRADWSQPEVAKIDIDRDDLSLFAAANFASPAGIRDLASMAELWHTYDSLVRPLEEWSEPGDIVCLVPHGALHILPLHALRVGGSYLIERNPVVYVPSVSALRHSQAGRGEATTRAGRRAAVFGDSRRNLPAASVEATMVAELFGVEANLGERVSRDSLLLALTSADIVHFAGHAGFDALDPLDSGLQLAGSDTLTASEIFGSPAMGASLVTLSGCETGLSRNQPGDELIGLVRAFLYARASSVVVSLWSVADDSTGFLMRRFYEHLLCNQSMYKVDALRVAILETMAEPRWESFYYWAPFVIIGDWR